MIIYSISDFRMQLNKLQKKSKDGYSSCYFDICEFLKLEFSTIVQSPEFLRQVSDTQKFKKAKLKNTALKLSSINGYRLIYMVDTSKKEIYLLYIYPKRGCYANENISRNEEFYFVEKFKQEQTENILEIFELN